MLITLKLLSMGYVIRKIWKPIFVGTVLVLLSEIFHCCTQASISYLLNSFSSTHYPQPDALFSPILFRFTYHWAIWISFWNGKNTPMDQMVKLDWVEVVVFAGFWLVQLIHFCELTNNWRMWLLRAYHRMMVCRTPWPLRYLASWPVCSRRIESHS